MSARDPFRQEDIEREKRRAREGQDALEDVLSDEDIIDEIQERHPENVPVARPSDESLSGGRGGGDDGDDGGDDDGGARRRRDRQRTGRTTQTGADRRDRPRGDEPGGELRGSTDPAFAEEIFSSPQRQNQFRRRFEQQLRQRGVRGAQIRPGDIRFEETDGGVRGSLIAGADVTFAENLGDVEGDVDMPEGAESLRVTEEGEAVARVDREAADREAVDAFRREDLQRELARARAGRESRFTPRAGVEPFRREDLEREVERARAGQESLFTPSRATIEEAVEARTEARTGTDVVPGVDFRVIRNEAGGFEVVVPGAGGLGGLDLGGAQAAPGGRRAAETQIEAQLEQEVGFDLNPGEDIIFTAEGGEVRGELTESAQREFQIRQRVASTPLIQATEDTPLGPLFRSGRRFGAELEVAAAERREEFLLDEEFDELVAPDAVRERVFDVGEGVFQGAEGFLTSLSETRGGRAALRGIGAAGAAVDAGTPDLDDPLIQDPVDAGGVVFSDIEDSAPDIRAQLDESFPGAGDPIIQGPVSAGRRFVSTTAGAAPGVTSAIDAGLPDTDDPLVQDPLDAAGVVIGEAERRLPQARRTLDAGFPDVDDPIVQAPIEAGGETIGQISSRLTPERLDAAAALTGAAPILAGFRATDTPPSLENIPDPREEPAAFAAATLPLAAAEPSPVGEALVAGGLLIGGAAIAAERFSGEEEGPLADTGLPGFSLSEEADGDGEAAEEERDLPTATARVEETPGEEIIRRVGPEPIAGLGAGASLSLEEITRDPATVTPEAQAVALATAEAPRQPISTAADAELPGLFPPEIEQPEEPIGRGFFPAEQVIEPPRQELPELLAPTDASVREGAPTLTPSEIEQPEEPIGRGFFPAEQAQPEEPIGRGFFPAEVEVPTLSAAELVELTEADEAERTVQRSRFRRRRRVPSELIPDEPATLGRELDPEEATGGGAIGLEFLPDPRSMDIPTVETEFGEFALDPELGRVVESAELEATLEPEFDPVTPGEALGPPEAVGGEFQAATGTAGLQREQTGLGRLAMAEARERPLGRTRPAEEIATRADEATQTRMAQRTATQQAQQQVTTPTSTGVGTTSFSATITVPRFEVERPFPTETVFETPVVTPREVPGALDLPERGPGRRDRDEDLFARETEVFPGDPDAALDILDDDIDAGGTDVDAILEEL